MPAKRSAPPVRPRGRFREIMSLYTGEHVGWSIYPDDLPTLARRAVSCVDSVLAIRFPQLAAEYRAEIADQCVFSAFRSGGLPVSSSRRPGSLRADSTMPGAKATPPSAGKPSRQAARGLRRR